MTTASASTPTRTRDEIIALDKRLIWRPYTRMDTYIRDTQPVVARAAYVQASRD